MNRWLEKMQQAQQARPKATPQSITLAPPSNLERLRALYRSGRLKGMGLELPGRPHIYDLEHHLTRLGSRTLTDADHAEVEAIAALVVHLPFLVN